ncbi:Ig-like domain-containing protein [Accumulibacter sp.]|uniref:Ig-like domain-containing protein n=1 Tax=Accumulibacter sp. TaxID=2053492 RepID=UPI0026223D1F|nr:Ig-like domain-containing protein [Accumulibacter sp.]
MEFYNGATLLATVLTPPYQFTWNNVGAGTYSLTAKAYSTQGLSKTSPAANVTVSVNQLPVSAC